MTLPLRRDDVLALAGRFRDEDKSLWDDVELLAGKFVAGRSLADWHHLLLAVGNFKRQGGTIIREPLRLQPRSSTPAPHFIPEVKLDAKRAETWHRLQERVDGLGVATTTTLLAALWPWDHVIMDQRALRAAVLLTGSPPNGPGEPSWPQYEWYRPAVLATAASTDCPPVEVERALFMFDKERM